MESKFQQRLNQKKQLSEKEYGELVDRYKQQMKKLKEGKENSLNELMKQNQTEMDHEKIRGKEALSQVRENNEKDLRNTTDFGEKKITEAKIQNEKKEARLEADSKREFEKKNKQWEVRKDRQDTEYRNLITTNKGEYEKQMTQQRQHFESTYQKNDVNNRLSLQIQSQNHAKALAEEFRQFLKQSSKYDGKEKDPFYKVIDRGSELSEDRHFYVLRAYVPEHEKDNINVIIHKDKASINTQRKFNESFTDPDSGKKLSTHSNQSLREEFPFEVPIISEGVARERSGDYIFITIPKLQSFKNRSIKG